MTQQQILENLAICFQCTPEDCLKHVEKYYGGLRQYLNRHGLTDLPIEAEA